MRKKPKAPPFVMIRRDLLKDPEWQKLSNRSKVLYVYLRAKFNYKTKESVSLTYSEMKKVMNPRTMHKAFEELEKGKWIEKTKLGGLFGGVCTYQFIGKFKDFFYDKRNSLFYS